MIQSDGVLTPFYQGVFSLSNIEAKDVVLARKIQSLEPLKHAIHGFESLLRVNNKRLEEAVNDGDNTKVDLSYMNSSIVFDVAKKMDLSLGIKLED